MITTKPCPHGKPLLPTDLQKFVLPRNPEGTIGSVHYSTSPRLSQHYGFQSYPAFLPNHQFPNVVFKDLPPPFS